MPLYLVDGPPVEPVTLDEVKSHLRIDHTDDDNYLRTLITVAREALDARDGVLGRAIVLQTWDWKIDRFDRFNPEEGCRWSWGGSHFYRWRLRLPLPPLQQLVSIKYLDSDNIEQTMSSSDYVVTGLNGWGYAEVEPTQTAEWPWVYCVPEAIRIRIKCGFAPDSLVTPTDYTLHVPEKIKLAIKIMVAAWYENRDTLGEMPDSVCDLVMNHKVVWAA